MRGWHHFVVVGKGNRTRFFLDGAFVGEADRQEQSDVYYVGNSSDGELFAEFLDDVRIYGVSLSDMEAKAIYGGGFGDQFYLRSNRGQLKCDSFPRIFSVRFGKDSQSEAVSGLVPADWSLSGGTMDEVNATGLTGGYLVSVDPNSSVRNYSLSLPSGGKQDDAGNFVEAFRYDFKAHERVYKDDDLLSRWAFDETNGSWVRDLGPGRNDGMLMGNAQLGPGRFGSGLVLDGTGDYLDIPRFRGLYQEGNLSIAAWVKLNDLGFSSDLQDSGIFTSNGNNQNSLLLWYNVNASGTGNRTYTFNLGSTGTGLNRLDGPDGVASQGKWQHVVAVMEDRKRFLYADGQLGRRNPSFGAELFAYGRFGCPYRKLGCGFQS